MAVVQLLLSVLLTSSADNSFSHPGPPDSTPTAWACSVDTLISGKDCVFEAESTVDLKALNQADDNVRLTRQLNQSEDNVRFAKQLGDVVCAQAIARAGESAEAGQSTCRREFTRAAEVCGLSGKSNLVDSKGRFPPAARSCYLSLARALQRSSVQVALADSCCECVNSGQCKSASPQCTEHLVNDAPTTGEISCMRKACARACSGIATGGEE